MGFYKKSTIIHLLKDVIKNLEDQPGNEIDNLVVCFTPTAKETIVNWKDTK